MIVHCRESPMGTPYNVYLIDDGTVDAVECISNIGAELRSTMYKDY
jgi:hypothetical protein